MKSWLVAVPSALVASILSITLAGQAQPAQTPTAVAYISGNRVLGESSAGRAQVARIQALQQQKGGELRVKQQALEATRQKLAEALDPATRGPLQQKEQEQRTDFERSAEQVQADVQALQREVNGEMQQRVKAVLDDLVKTRNYQLVLNADTSVVWATPEVDLTGEVIARLDGK